MLLKDQDAVNVVALVVSDAAGAKKVFTPQPQSGSALPPADIVFQLYACIDGKRFRRNSPTRPEIEAKWPTLASQLLAEPSKAKVQCPTPLRMQYAKKGFNDRLVSRQPTVLIIGRTIASK
jgi:hypothetical protein